MTDHRKHLEFFHRVFVYARLMAWEKEPSKKVGDLMDAVHELPSMPARGEQVTEREIRLYLEPYNSKWAKHGEFTRFSLVAVWKDCVEGV